MSIYRLLLFFLIMSLPVVSYATVDYMAVNHITKEYYWGDDDHRAGWIAWKNVPETQLGTAEEDFIKSGYTRTYYPYKIETAIVLVMGFLFYGLSLFRKRHKRHAGII